MEDGVFRPELDLVKGTNATERSLRNSTVQQPHNEKGRIGDMGSCAARSIIHFPRVAYTLGHRKGILATYRIAR
jgi:hypothetical protein